MSTSFRRRQCGTIRAHLLSSLAATCLLPIGLLTIALPQARADGEAAPATSPARASPTPYPTDPQAWPGRGVIRVFDWMSDNREYFWRERDRRIGSVVFAGDSLIGSWRTLPAEFPELSIANRGIGGDVSRGLLFRFEEDVLALRPKAVVILIGTNDLTARQPAADTLWNIEAIVELRDAQQPETPIILCTVPASDNARATVDARQRDVLNAGLHKLAATRSRVSILDLFKATTTDDGALDPRWFKPDRLHLDREGYGRWKTALSRVFRELGIL